MQYYRCIAKIQLSTGRRLLVYVQYLIAFIVRQRRIEQGGVLCFKDRGTSNKSVVFKISSIFYL